MNAVPADLPAADAEARLEQILHNLVGNAVKFTETGKVEISAATEEGRRPTEGGQAQLVVTVEDTGIGIAEDQRERIFEAFEQADSGIQRAFGGTGLGLTVTRELVELHGGRIWVESTVGLARHDATSGRTERLEHDLDLLDAAAGQLKRLLDELFELSRVGVQANPPEEVAFGDLVGQAVADLAPTIAERGVDVEVTADLPAIYGDRARLLETVRHLMSNAVKYLGWSRREQAAARRSVLRCRGPPAEKGT